MDDNNNAPPEDFLRKEGNRLLEKLIMKANKEAIRRLREQRIQLLKDCILSSDDDGENMEFNVNKLDQEWQEKTNRTTLILETIYDNLRMRAATNTYKNTFIIKNKDGESQYRVMSIIMTEKLTKQADDNTQIQGTIKNKKCKIQYQHGDGKENIVENIENKTTIEGKVIDNITVKDP